MPASAADARDLLIASVLCDDPTLYIDDRWLYDVEEHLAPVGPVSLENQGPRVIRSGDDVTLVGCGYTTKLCLQAAEELSRDGVSAEVIDLRVLNPLDPAAIIESTTKTNHLIAVDGDWKSCGMASEILALATEARTADHPPLRAARVTHPDSPAPTSSALEKEFYFSFGAVVSAANRILE